MKLCLWVVGEKKRLEDATAGFLYGDKTSLENQDTQELRVL